MATTGRIGTGESPVVRSRREYEWPALGTYFARESINRPTDWTIRDDRHVVIVHLGGKMSVLETELDGRLGSVGPATPGELWSVPAGSDYASYAQGGDIEFSVIYIPKKTPSENIDFEIAPLFGVRDDVLHSMVRRLAHVTDDSHDIANMEAETLADAIGVHVVAKYHRQPAGHSRSPPSCRLTSYQARMVREFVWDNLGQQITIGQISKLVGMSTHDLLAAFREVFQTTPAQYVITQRLRRAQWLLLYSSWEITRIALDCGFSSHSHLTSTFKNRFGYPPSRFRKKVN